MVINERRNTGLVIFRKPLYNSSNIFLSIGGNMNEFIFKAYDKYDNFIDENNVISIVEKSGGGLTLRIYHVNGEPLKIKEVKQEAI